MSTPFRACAVDQTADGFQMGIQQIEQRDLSPGASVSHCTRRKKA